MKALVALTAIFLPGVVCAQAMYNPQPTMNEPNYTTTQAAAYAPSGDTPTMQRQKYVRAVALREEAAQLLAADGGTFTQKHEAYVRRKALAILGSGR
jgi:hypothetical protein